MTRQSNVLLEMSHSSSVGEDKAIGVLALSKRFRVADGVVTALEKVTLDVRPGEFVAIVGPSGCGKSTLLKILTGLLAPSSGETRIGGVVTVGPRRDIGTVFQSPLLFAWRTVLERDASCRRSGSRSRPLH